MGFFTYRVLTEKLANKANGLQMVILSVKDRSDSHSDHDKIWHREIYKIIFTSMNDVILVNW